MPDAAQVLVLKDDEAHTEVRASSALTASFVASSAMDVRGFKEIDFLIRLTDDGSGPITELKFRFEATTEHGPTNYSLLYSESIASGVATLSIYEPTLTITGVIDVILTVPVRGHHMRILAQASVGTPTDSACQILALRRVA
jgi:hypothetical protein